MEISAENDRFSSNELVVGIDIKGHETPKDDSPSVYFLHSKSDPLPGNLIVDKFPNSQGNSGIMILGVVLSVTIAAVASGFIVHRIARFVCPYSLILFPFLQHTGLLRLILLPAAPYFE